MPVTAFPTEQTTKGDMGASEISEVYGVVRDVVCKFHLRVREGFGFVTVCRR